MRHSGVDGTFAWDMGEFLGVCQMSWENVFCEKCKRYWY